MKMIFKTFNTSRGVQGKSNLLKFIILSLILSCYSCNLFSQQRSRLQDLGSKAKKEWQLQLDLQPSLSGEYEYALLKNGVVTYSQNTKTLFCMDFNGQKIWGKSGIPSPTVPIASPDGEYLYIYRLTVPEGQKGIGSIWTKDGDMLWQQEGQYYQISSSSKFLVAYYSRLNPMPLKVLDIKTGQTLWEREGAFYWQAAASENERLVYYTHRSVKLFDLKTGKLIWEKTIESDVQKNLDTSRIHMAKNGKTIALQAMYLPDNGIETYVFDTQGQILWRRNKKVIPGKTNGGIVRAISDDGRFIAMSDLQGFTLFSTDKPEPVWEINERMKPQYIQKFANGVLAFRSHPQNKTRVMLLNADGTIKQDYHFSQKINFNIPWSQKALVVEPKPDGLGLFLFDLNLNSSK